MTATSHDLATPAFRSTDTQPLVSEVLRGLMADRKTLPPKLFYDAHGAALFERICEQPEYYLTRAEHEILERDADEIAELIGPGAALIEYGSGAGVKVRRLLDALEKPQAYIPIDISGDQLHAVTNELRRAYPGVEMRPVQADYTQAFSLPPLAPDARRIAFFPGSTIGNFAPDAAAFFLRRIRRTIGPSGCLILGVDRVKAIAVLEAAYNDAAGITAQFNLNLLTRLNRELQADFDRDAFQHRALFDADERRIEMHLVSTEPQGVHVAGVPIPFAEGESIWTESSYKYDRTTLDQLAWAAGFRVERLWTDTLHRFWTVLLVSA